MDADFQEFLNAYLVAALWSSVSDDGDGITDNHSVEDIDAQTLKELTAICLKFWTQNRRYILGEPEPPTCNNGSSPTVMAGHDFWLTSAGHGAGFWDGDWPVYGDVLTARSEALGEVFLYVGDDGKIYN